MTPVACLACSVGGNWLMYSVAAGESLSVAGVLLTGVVPAILLGGAMVTLCFVAAWRKGCSLNPRGLSLRGIAGQIPRSFLAVSPPILIVGGLVGGVLPATHAAGIAVFHMLWMGVCLIREIRGQDLSVSLVYASLFILIPFVPLLAVAYGLVHFPEVFAWLPEMFGY